MSRLVLGIQMSRTNKNKVPLTVKCNELKYMNYLFLRFGMKLNIVKKMNNLCIKICAEIEYS